MSILAFFLYFADIINFRKIFMKKTLICLALAGLLTACGGSDNDRTEGSSPVPPTAPVGTETGVLTDGIISGVTYITSSGAEGVTNEKGEFKFNDGEKVKFLIGDVQLGQEIEAKKHVTPLDLAQTEIARTNLMVFLQSLDTDSNHDNGISISTEAANALLNKSLDFSKAPTAFATDVVSTGVVTTEKLITPEKAAENFQSTFYKDIAGTWEIGRNANSAVLIHILEDGRYALGQAEAADGDGTPGIETGELNWNATTSVISPRIIQDSNGEWGLSHPAGGKPYTLNYDGTTLILTEPGINTEYRLSRVKQSANGLVGAWRFSDTHLFAFFDTNYYFFLDTEGGDDCGWPGIEYGKFTLSGNTLTTTEVLFDTNECGGLQDSSDGSKTIANINVSAETLILHPQGEGPVTLQRVR